MHVNQDYMAQEREEAQKKLDDLHTRLTETEGAHFKILKAVSELPLLRAVMEVVEDEKPELIVVGSDNYNYSSNSFIAGNVISIAKISPVRVLIVPSHSTYQVVKQALVPCNYTMVEELNKLDSYQASSAAWREKKLLVLDVDPTEKYLHPDGQFNKALAALHEYLKNFKHEVFSSNNKNIINGILDFCKEHEVQVIIALPRKHSFLYSLTHKSISEAIYRNAMEPILILK
jgi:K+-sensing histidine kinase KdpD